MLNSNRHYFFFDFFLHLLLNGVVDDEVASEAEAFARARHFLAFMPEHVGQLARRSNCTDPVHRREEALLDLVPRDPKAVYSMRRCMEMVFDQGTVFEIGRMWGRACITALARLDGWPVAVLASDPSYLGGSWDAKSSEKVERFVKLADQFRLPIVHLVDNPGFMIGREAEMAGTIRYGVQAMNAVYKASVPLASVVLRRARSPELSRALGMRARRGTDGIWSSTANFRARCVGDRAFRL